MEFVTQLWAYKSDRFFLGIECPEVLKNHIWLLLIVLKTSLVGCSLMHLSQPDVFNRFFPFEPAAGSPAFSGSNGETTLRFKLTCLDDVNIQTQLYRYYYWQGTILLFLGITYIRILRSGVNLVGTESGRSAAKGFDPNTQIEFMNNTIKIRQDDPRRQRDQLILNSWTGAILGLCSIMAALFSCFSLLPAIYSLSCHSKHSWSRSHYPGASFALTEALMSISFLALLMFAAILTFILDYIPRFFLRTLPRKWRQYSRRVQGYFDKQKVWKPKNYIVDYGIENLSNSGEYDCTQLSKNFDSRNLSTIQKDQSTFYLNMSSTLDGTHANPGQSMNLSLLTKLV